MLIFLHFFRFVHYTVGAQQGVYEVNRVSHIFENVGFTATLDCEMDGAVYASSDYIGWTKQMLPSDTANEAAAAVAEGRQIFILECSLLRTPAVGRPAM